MTMTMEELQQAEDTWKQVHLTTVISKRNTVESLNILKYDLKGVKCRVCTIRKSCNSTICDHIGEVSCKLMTHSKCMNVLIEPIVGYPYCHSQILRHLETRVGKINVCLRNHSAKQIALPKELLSERLQQEMPFYLCWC